MSNEKKAAVVGPVEPTVKPRVWMVRRHDAPNYWIPFLHEPVDALKDPEREVVRLHWPEEISAERERWLAAATAASQELCHCAPWSAGGQAFAALRGLIDRPNAEITDHRTETNG